MNQRLVLNRLLSKLELPSLEDAANLVPVLAAQVRDHDHLRALISTCAPEQRHDMYESLRPYLRFKPHELDWYIAEAKAVAEACKLPEWDSEKGAWKEPKPTPEITGDEIGIPLKAIRESDKAETKVIRKAVEETLMSGRLTLTCRKCTRTGTFPADKKRMADAVQKARDEGWVYDHESKFEMCPKCSEIYLAVE